MMVVKWQLLMTASYGILSDAAAPTELSNTVYVFICLHVYCTHLTCVDTIKQ